MQAKAPEQLHAGFVPLQGGGIQPLNLYGGALGRKSRHTQEKGRLRPIPLHPAVVGKIALASGNLPALGRFLNGNAILAQDGNGQIHIALGLQRRGENNFAVAGKQRQGKQQARDKLRADVARQPVNTAFQPPGNLQGQSPLRAEIHSVKGKKLSIHAQRPLGKPSPAQKPGGNPQRSRDGNEKTQGGARLPTVNYRVLPAQTGGVQSESARVLVKADLGAQGACRRDSGLDVLA